MWSASPESLANLVISGVGKSSVKGGSANYQVHMSGASGSSSVSGLNMMTRRAREDRL